MTFLRAVDGDIPDTVLSALVNRRQVMLDFPLRGQVELDLVRYGDREGESVYKRSVSLMLYEACRELYPDARPTIGQSLGNCYHYLMRGEHPPLEEMATALERRMGEIHREQRPFVRSTVTIEEVENYFRSCGYQGKLELLETRRSSTVHTISCGGFVDLAHGPYAPHTGCLPTFGVIPYGDGLVLRFPRRSDRSRLPEFTPRAEALQTPTSRPGRGRSCSESTTSVSSTGSVSTAASGRSSVSPRVCTRRRSPRLPIRSCRIVLRTRLVLVAGPSGSGKTTFAKRLGIQLRVNGIEPVALSLDNYYVDRDATPIGENGEPDFEALEAIDLALLREHLAELLAGRQVATPRFDFSARAPQGRRQLGAAPPRRPAGAGHRGDSRTQRAAD